jgi:predicted O-methyltransferase YrrM
MFTGTLLDGRVADEDAEESDVIAARSFNEIFLEHPDLDAMLLPVGNGIAIGARKQ